MGVSSLVLHLLMTLTIQLLGFVSAVSLTPAFVQYVHDLSIAHTLLLLPPCPRYFLPGVILPPIHPGLFAVPALHHTYLVVVWLFVAIILTILSPALLSFLLEDRK